MANTQAMATSFKQEILQGIHALGTSVVRAGTGADTLKAALFLASATINASTTTYSTTGELAATGNYTAGGVTVTATTATDTTNDRASLTFADASWSSATFSARGCIYVLVLGGASSADPILGFLDFGATRTGGGGTFVATVTTPAYLTNPT